MVKLLSEINRGGQAVVWKAESAGGELVAAKVLELTSNPTVDEQLLARFDREVRYQQGLVHDQIVEVLEVDLAADPPMFTMPLATSSLSEKIRELDDQRARGDSLDYDTIVMTFYRPILLGMAYAHSRNVVHRDLKPGNILLYDDGPRIADFGLGKDLAAISSSLTRMGARFGTVGYMAPEQHADSKTVTERGDVFSLGWILYELLATRTGFTPILPLVPAKYRFIIHRCLENNPADRFANAGEIQQEIDRVLGGISTTADEVRRWVHEAERGDRAKLLPIARALIEGPGDRELYLEVLVSCPTSAIPVLVGMPGFALVLTNLRSMLDDVGPYEADQCSFFLERAFVAAYDAPGAVEASGQIIDALFHLAALHQRQYIVDRLHDVLLLASRSDTHLSSIAASIRRHNAYPDLVSEALSGVGLPAWVKGDRN